MNGSLNLTDCQISQSGFTFIIRPAAGKSYTLKANTVRLLLVSNTLIHQQIEAEAWTTVLLSTVKKLSLKETKVRFSSIVCE